MKYKWEHLGITYLNRNLYCVTLESEGDNILSFQKKTIVNVNKYPTTEHLFKELKNRLTNLPVCHICKLVKVREHGCINALVDDL